MRIPGEAVDHMIPLHNYRNPNHPVAFDLASPVMVVEGSTACEVSHYQHTYHAATLTRPCEVP
jgi:hypothetical protein